MSCTSGWSSASTTRRSPARSRAIATPNTRPTSHDRTIEHLRGGKEQLGAEAIRVSGRLYEQLIPAVFDPAPDLVSGIRAFFAGAAEHLAQTDYEDACPIATVTLETASCSEPMRVASAEVFERWIAAGLPRFTAAGLSEAQARRLVVCLLSALEGAFVLARAARSTEALHAAGELVAAATERALAEG